MSAASAVNTLKRVLAALLRVSSFEMEAGGKACAASRGGAGVLFRGGGAGRCDGMILLAYLARNYWYACL